MIKWWFLSTESIASNLSKPLQSVFKLDQVEAAFQQFVARFEPTLQHITSMNPTEAVFVRTLVIHEYRKVLLSDLNLSKAPLHADWPDVYARQLSETLYGQLLSSSEAFLLAHVQTLDGKLTKMPRSVSKRQPDSRD